MELVITAIYVLLIWLIWYKWKVLKVTVLWMIIWPSLWVAAISAELISLGQFCPYGRTAFVWTYVYQLSPEYGGIVTEVYAKPNVSMEKGDKLFQMDATPWEYDVNRYAAALAGAKQNVKVMKASVDEASANVKQIQASLKISEAELAQYTQAAKANAVAKIKLEEITDTVQSQKAELEGAQAALAKAQLSYNSMIDGEHTEVAELQARLDKANYDVAQTTIVAPTNGYVVDMNLQAGVEVRLKQQVMTFVEGDLDKYWIMAKVPQFGVKRIKPGDNAEVMLKMYPSEVFEAEVVEVIWATGEAQAQTGAVLPSLATLGGGEFGGQFYAVKLSLVNEPADYVPRFGASGQVAIYPESAPDFLVLLRRLEIRMDSWISYLYR
jgi:multidrug resistance efflux pump